MEDNAPDSEEGGMVSRIGISERNKWKMIYIVTTFPVLKAENIYMV